MSDTSITRFRTGLGEPIAAGTRYAVTADGQPDINAPHLLFLAPEHQWRIQWAPEEPATVHLTREDHDDLSPVWLAPLGLLGLAVHAVRGRFRIVSATAFQAAADEILQQMSRQYPAGRATVTIPEGFTLHTVAPAMVAGSVEAHNRVLAGAASRTGAAA
jgi:hypothetical protein